MTLSRRSFLRTTGLLVGGGLAGCGLVGGAESGDRMKSTWRMPDEGEPHSRTWMAFATSSEIWGRRLLPRVQRDLALIAKTIAKHEPVSMLVRQSDLNTAQGLLAALPATAHKVDLIVSPLDDLWIRDTGCSFVVKQNEPHKRAGVNFNFNGWGRKQIFDQDAKIAAFMAQKARVELLTASLVLEGGGIEVDGQGMALISESCVLNENRNPGVSRADFEAKLSALLGLRKIVWIPGIKGKDITDGHTDFYARFAGPGLVLAGFDSDPDSYDHAVTQANLEALGRATDLDGRPLEIVTLTAPLDTRDASENFAAGYIGFYLCNGAIICQEFGDQPADEAAKATLKDVFPGRVIEQLNVDGIAAGGGSVHCCTQQEPAG